MDPSPGWIDEVYDGVRYGPAGRVIAETARLTKRVTINSRASATATGLLLDGLFG